MQLQTLIVKARIKKENIVLFSWIIESHEGMGIMRTIDAKSGLVEFMVSPFFEKEFFEVITSLGEEIEFIDNAISHG
ncbi:MAG: DUF4911 domain-containing protein [Candidatus Schekmanbacteria bacterium]|nr:DUF4911 domain-containing protein [Candidatus Schekmanbacteria bacterium]